jgi:hypothetical protein
MGLNGKNEKVSCSEGGTYLFILKTKGESISEYSMVSLVVKGNDIRHNFLTFKAT